MSHTFDGFLHDEEFLNPIQWIINDNICVDFVDKMPIINYKTGEQKEYNNSNFMSGDDKYFIVSGKNKTVFKSFEDKEPRGIYSFDMLFLI